MKTVLNQLLSFLPKRDFRRCVEKHRGDHNVRTFSCWDQFVCLFISQLTHKESLREIELCIRGMGKLLYHSGVRGKISKSALADASYLTVAIAKKQLNILASLTEIIRFLPQALFLKVPLYKAFCDLDPDIIQKTHNSELNQLNLF